MKDDLVVVQSKTINNESVCVVLYTTEKNFGGVKDVREISRSYIFQNFRANMPYKMAKKLVDQNPEEFKILDVTDKKAEKDLKEKVENQKKRQEGFECEHCGKVCKSKAGLLSHIRSNHPDEYTPRT